MATRLYLPSHGSLSISPTPDSSWEDVAAVAKRNLAQFPGQSAFASVTVTEGTSNTNARDLLHGMFLSPPLKAGSYNGCTIKGQVRALESNANANCMTQIVVRLLDNTGAVKQVLYGGHSTTSVADEYGTSLSNRRIPHTAISPVTLANFTCADGDRISVELGTRFNNTSATSYTAQHNYGGAGASDLPEDITTTTALNPWIEFSADLEFQVPTRHSSSPPVVKLSTTGNTSTATFTPPQGYSIIVAWTRDEQNGGSPAPSISNTGFTVDGWTLVSGRHYNTPSGADVGYAYLWKAKVTSSAPGVITVSHASATMPRMMVTSVYDPAIVDADNPVGAVTGGSFTSGTSVSASLTPQTTGGGIRMIWLDWMATGVPNPIADVAVIDAYHIVGGTTSVQLATTQPTVAGVSQTIGATATASMTDGNWIAYEIRAAQATNIPVSGSDSGTFGATESSGLTVTMSLADSGQISATDASAMFATKALSDSGTVGSTESSQVFKDIGLSDSGSIGSAESASPALTSATADSGTIGATEGSSLFQTESKALSDSGTLSATEATTILVSVSVVDSGGLAASDSSSVFKTIALSDSGSIGATEVSGRDFAMVRSDSGTLSSTDVSSIYVAAAVGSSDSGTVSSTEAASISSSSALSDSATVTATESSSVFKAISLSESGNVSAAESAVVFNDRPGVDSGIISTTESANVEVSGTVIKSVGDSGTVSATDTRVIFSTLGLSDETTLSAQDASALFKEIELTDSAVVSLDDEITTLVVEETSDSGLILALESVEIQELTGLTVQVWTGSGFDSGQLRVWDGTKLVTPQINIWDGEAWV